MHLFSHSPPLSLKPPHFPFQILPQIPKPQTLTLNSSQKMYFNRDPSQFTSSQSTWNSQSEATSSPSSQSDTYLVGFVIANIVGTQYYSGSISGRELVGLVREPLNPYDPNAIKVLNTRGVQVGHIEKGVARVLAPLVDDNLVNVEGIVPNGKAGKFKIPVQVHVFSRLEAFGNVRDYISRGGLQLISNEEASFTLSEAAIVKQTKAKGEKSVDEIFKLVDENASKKSAIKALDPPKAIIKSELFSHQKEGLGWLVHRENSNDLPPFWEEKGREYVNALTNYQTDNRPEPLRGGIFADDMGLGKTLTLLSLISFDKCGGLDTKYSDENGDIDDKFIVSSNKKTKRGRSSKTVSKRRKTGDSKSNGCYRKVTLIVCPPSVFSSWVTQLSEHTNPGKLKVYMYYGERTRDIDELYKYDIILTTYSTLASEENWDESPMKMMEWWRVVLDEAHVIKNANAQMSRAVTNLRAKRRWVVTGTPIQNSSLDLFSLMAFLRFEPFSIKSYWSSLVQRPLAQGDPQGLMRLQVLMATISLRRTKDKTLIGLPPKTIETCFVELSNDEREIYDKMETQAKSVVQSYIQAGNLTNNYSTVLSIILRLRQICTDVALCPPDLQSLFAFNNIADVSNNPELLKKMVSQLQDGEDIDCPICICPPIDIVITICAHIFCKSCILKTIKKTKPFCPLCRHPLSESELFSSPPESSNPENTKPSSSTSSKVSALLKLLISQRDQNPKVKSVIFSQFQKMLLLLEEPLKKSGFNILRLDGSMNAKKRSCVIEEFGDLSPSGPTILLASLRASGTGINLTCANHVYLLEPWWNPAVEEQAMDRVHRIGQKEDVKIVRMIAKNSIEERVLELQEKKKTLAKDAFGKRGQKEKKEVNVDDLRTLMSL